MTAFSTSFSSKIVAIVRPIGSLCVFSPPRIFDKSAIDRLVAILDQSLHATLDDLTRDGFL